MNPEDVVVHAEVAAVGAGAVLEPAEPEQDEPEQEGPDDAVD